MPFPAHSLSQQFWGKGHVKLQHSVWNLGLLQAGVPAGPVTGLKSRYHSKPFIILLLGQAPWIEVPRPGKRGVTHKWPSFICMLWCIHTCIINKRNLKVLLLSLTCKMGLEFLALMVEAGISDSAIQVCPSLVPGTAAC